MHSFLSGSTTGALTLPSDEVHVWRVSLDVDAAVVESLAQVLSDDERARAARFCFQKDRESFTVARGILRVLLGRYLDHEPGRLEFSYGPHGRPTLRDQNAVNEFCFNVSHSKGLALYAFTRNRQIGIDVEWIRSEMASEQVAERFFAPQEVATLRALPSDAQLEAFFNCWTRKEAFVKASGEGLSLPLNQFVVSLVPDDPAALLTIEGDRTKASLWSLQELNAGTGYVAALAVKGNGWRLKCWQWPSARP